MPVVSEARVTILAGENWLGVKQALDKLVSDFTAKHGELSVEKIDAEEKSLDEIAGSAGTQSLLMPQKLCVIYNLSANSDVSTSRQESEPRLERRGKEAADKIEQILDLSSENTRIILVEGKLDKRGAYYKTLKSKPGFSEFEELDEQRMTTWLMEEAKRLGGTLSRNDAQYLYSRVGGNQSRLANEIKKLIDYDKLISRETIDLLSEPTPSSTIFDLLNAAFSNNKRQALKIYDDQRLQKVEPQQILAMLGWQMHIVALVKSAKDTNPTELAKKAAINPFVIQKSRQIASKLDRAQTRKILADLVNIDWSVKNKGLNADDAIKNLLVSI